MPGFSPVMHRTSARRYGNPLICGYLMPICSDSLHDVLLKDAIEGAVLNGCAPTAVPFDTSVRG